MKNAEIRKKLSEEKTKWINKSYTQLLESFPKSEDSIFYERGVDEESYVVEVSMVEKKQDYLHIAISIDDNTPRGGWLSKFFRYVEMPTFDWIVYRDGRIDIGNQQ